MAQVSYGTITITDTTDIDSIKNWYLATSASSGVTKETSGWTSTIQQMTTDKQYLWNYEQILGTGGVEISSTQPVIIGRYGKDGAEGNSITSIDEYYQITNSTSNPGSSGWSKNTLVVPTSTNKYLWNYQVIHYSKTADEGSYSDARIIGVYGDKGERGTSILKVTTQPTTTSGTAGGFSYSYRMSLSTVINESGKTEVLKGDIIEYNSNHYQVGYVNSSYVYLGPVTSIKGADSTQYYVFIRYSANSNGSGYVATPTSSTKYIGVYMGTSSSPPAYDNDGWTWSKYMGTDGVSVIGVRELYWLKTNSTNPSQITWNSSTSQPSQTIYSTDRANSWTSTVPTYVTNGTYYTCVETTLSNGTKVWSAPVQNIALTNANSKATEALTQVTTIQETVDATEANMIALQSRLKRIWINEETSGDYVAGTYAASGIEDIAFKESNPQTYGYNTLLRHNKLALRYNTIDMTALTTNALTFYIPTQENDSWVQGKKGLEITAEGIDIYNPNGIKGLDIKDNGLTIYSIENSSETESSSIHPIVAIKQDIFTLGFDLTELDESFDPYSEGNEEPFIVWKKDGGNTYLYEYLDDIIIKDSNGRYALKEKINTIEQNIATNTTNIININGEINNINNNIYDITSQLNKAKNDISTNADNISINADNISTNVSNISLINARINKIKAYWTINNANNHLKLIEGGL